MNKFIRSDEYSKKRYMTEKDLFDKKGFVKMYDVSLDKIFTNKVLDVSDLETRQANTVSLVSYLGVIKKFSRKQRKIKRKLIQSGDFIPIDCIEVDDFGFEKPVDLKQYLKQEEYKISMRMNRRYNGYKFYLNPKYTHLLKTQIKIDISTQMDNNLFPLQIKSNKHKKPCATTLSYFKHYMVYLKNLDDKQLQKYVKVKFDLRKNLIKKYNDMFKSRNINSQLHSENISLDINYFITYYFGYNNIDETSFRILSATYKHKLFPELFVQCPCFLMGNTECNSMVNIHLFLMLFLMFNTQNDEEQNKYFKNFINKFNTDFIEPIVKRFIKIHNNSLDITIKNKIYQTQHPDIKNKKRKFKISMLHFQITTIICDCCSKEHVCCSYKLSKKFLKKKGIRMGYSVMCPNNTKCYNSKHNNICVKCGNCIYKHKKNKCPPPVQIEKPSVQEIETLQKALEEDSIETKKCPKCDNLVTKDENCDKVRCGAIDGGGQQGCGTQFCFRCGEDISELGDRYIDHLITSMKPDGSNTHWICKKFALPCPTCSIKQFWDGKSDKIMCGECKVEFDVDISEPQNIIINDSA